MITPREEARLYMEEIERLIASRDWVGLNQWLATLNVNVLSTHLQSTILRCSSRVRRKVPAYELLYNRVMLDADPNDPLWIGSFITDNPPRFRTYKEFDRV